MSSSPRRRRPRKPDGWEPIARWCQNHEPAQWTPVHEALLAIQDDTWAERYEHFDDVTNANAVIMLVEPGLVIVWRVITEYPDYFRVIFVGDPDDYTF